MDQGTNGVNGPVPAPEDLERRVRDHRESLDAILSELDRRRHELTDWRLQLRRHRKGALVLAGALIGGVAAYVVWRKRRAAGPAHKARRLWRALQRMVANPDAVAKRSPSLDQELLAAAGSPIAAMLAKRLVRHLLLPRER
jgi:hypothetical protein